MSFQQETSVTGAWDTDLSYGWFCENFMDCVIPTTEWKLFARKEDDWICYSYLGSICSAGVNKNTFGKWNDLFSLDDSRSVNNGGVSSDSVDGLSSLTSARGTHGFLFAGDSKGSRKYEGWNPAGMRFYNGMLHLIREQHGHTGCPFEWNILHRLATRPKGGSRNEDEIQVPRANNHVDQLMQIVRV